MQRRGGLLACIACTALLFAGCADSGSPSATGARSISTGTTPARAPHPHDDRGRAQLALLARSDIPERVVEQDNSRNHAECSPRRLFRHTATGIETTPLYTTERETRVQQSVLLFRDAAAAARAFATLDSPAKRRCIARYVQIEAIRRSASRVPRLIPQTITVEPAGQQSSAYRLTATVGGDSGALDVLVNRFGRALSSVSVAWHPSSRDLVFDDALVRRIAARVREAMHA